VLQAERVLLHTLGFDFNVEHPYKHLLKLAKWVNASQLEGDARTLTQVAWNFANDRSEIDDLDPIKHSSPTCSTILWGPSEVNPCLK